VGGAMLVTLIGFDAVGITSLSAARGVFAKYYPNEVIADKAMGQLRERFGGLA
jgi:hypothetical protein